MKIILLGLLMTFSTLVFGQGTVVTGSVVDSAGLEIYAGNALILNVTDSSIITGSFFLEGKFEISNVKEKKFLLKLTSMGYVDHVQMIDNSTNKNAIDVGAITLFDKTYDGIEVVGFKDRIKTLPGKMMVDVSSTMLGNSNSIMELLANTPNVLVVDDQVTVFGKGTPAFFMNNQKITLSELKAIPVSQVESVEVITNPSARFDADALAIIRIVTKDFVLEGFQVNLRQNIRKGYGLLSYSEVGLNYRKKRLSLVGNYNFETGTSRKIDAYTRAVELPTQTFYSSARTNSDFRYKNKSGYLLGLNYDLNKNALISAQYNGSYDHSEFNLRTINDLNVNGTAYEIESKSDIEPSKYLLHRFNLNYEVTFDTLGSNLFIGGQYADHAQNSENELTENLLNVSNDDLWLKHVDQVNNIDIYTGNLDYEKKLAAGQVIGVGGKYSKVQSSNSSILAIRPDASADWYTEPAFTTVVNYDESYLAGYFTFLQPIGKSMSLSLGLRGEQTNSLITQSNDIVPLYDTTYINLFPNATFKVGEYFTMNYGRKIKRVPFSYLNTNTIYIDSFSVSEGNPLLQPTFYNTIDLNFANMLVLSYSKVENEIQQFFLQDTINNRTILTFDNVRDANQFTGQLVIPIPSKKFLAYLATGCNYIKFNDERFAENEMKARPQFYVYAYGKFTVKKLFDLQMIGQYVGASNNGISSLKPFGNLDISVSRKFLGDALSVEVYAGDIFRNTIYDGRQLSGITTATFNVRTDTRFIRLGLKYNFGRLKESQFKIDKVGEDENKRAKTQ